MTPPVNLFEGEKNIVCKRENLHTSMVFGTYTLMFKLDSDLEPKLPHIKLQWCIYGGSWPKLFSKV